jgi:hypothetical protein
MGRLFLLALVNLAAYFSLRALWPGLLLGWRRGVFIALALFSLGVWALPMMLGMSAFATVPGPGVLLKVFSMGWSIAAIIVMLVGGPFALVRRWMERAPKSAEAPPVDLRRRNMLLNVGRSVPVLAAGTSSVGLATGISGFKVLEVEVPIRGLPAALDGFRIGQITDVHVGPFIDTDYLHRAVLAMNAAKVDLQVMTGDLIDDTDQLPETMAALSECRAPHGMLCVLGNHEHWRGIRPILEAYAETERRGAPVRLLVDSSLAFEHAGQRIRVVGVDYPIGRGPGHGVKAERWARSAEVAFRDAVPDQELVLCLSHHPDFFPYAAEKGARLTLAGHTHGGQVAFFGIPLFGFAFEFMLGRFRRKDSHLYVSGGTGHWMPFRLGVPPEVTLLTLRAAGERSA